MRHVAVPIDKAVIPLSVDAIASCLANWWRDTALWGGASNAIEHQEWAHTHTYQVQREAEKHPLYLILRCEPLIATRSKIAHCLDLLWQERTKSESFVAFLHKVFPYPRKDTEMHSWKSLEVRNNDSMGSILLGYFRTSEKFRLAFVKENNSPGNNILLSSR